MSEQDDLRKAISTLEAQRGAQDDLSFEAAVSALRARLEALEEAPSPSPEAERKQTTVLFADLSGFTALSENTDAEDVRNLVNICFERAGKVVKRYGGHIDKFIGDELMVVFGAPIAMEDHASRALYAALEIRDSLAALNEQHTQLLDYSVGFHFGINSGLVVAGTIGTEAKREYTVMGDPVNVAARLVAQAQPGEILVGASTHHLVRERFQFEDQGLTEFKGRVKPQHVFRLLGARPSAQAVDGVSPPSEMIGREQELRTIQEAFQDVAIRGQQRSVAVIGPAGIGKSRLQRSFRTWLADAHPEAVVLHGAAQPHMTTTPYFMIGEILRNWLGVKETNTATEIRQRLESSLAELANGDDDVVHALAAIMALEFAQEWLQHLAPEERTERVFSAFSSFVRKFTSRGPVLLQFEDLHWTDELSLDLLEHLFGELTEAPIFFLLLTRPILDPKSKPREIEARFQPGTHTRVVLTELNETASFKLVTSLVPGLDGTPDFIQAIADKGQGNPFFLEEVVATLIDQGVLVHDAAGMRAVGAPADLTVPDTVWGVLAERVDRLPPDEKRVIQGASVIGQLFWEGLVRELAQVEPSAPLTALNRRDFVDRLGPASFANDWEWSFRHVLMQEVAYSGLLHETRRAGHRTAAGWLEQRAADRRNEYSTLLAHHYQLGEDWAKTAEFAELAGDRGAAIFAHREAKASYLQALSALARLDADLETRRRQIDVTLKLARVSSFRPSEEVLQALEAGREFAEETGDRERQIRVLITMASWQYVSGQARRAAELALQCVADATEAGLEELLVVPYLILGRAMFLMGEYERCIEMTEKSNALATTYGHDLDEWAGLGLGPSLALLGAAYEMLGHYDKGHTLVLDSLHVAEQKGDLRHIAFAHIFLGAPACLLGRLGEAGEHLREAVTICEKTGDLAGLFCALGFLGHWYGQRDELEQATVHLDRALSIAAELESFVYVPFIQTYRAYVDIKTGRLPEAIAMAQRAIELGQTTRQQDAEAEAHRILAWALHHAQPSAPDAARGEFQTAVELHRKTGSQVLLSLTLYDLAAYLRLTGDEAAAAEAETDATAIARKLELDWLPIDPPVPRTAEHEQARRV